MSSSVMSFDDMMDLPLLDSSPLKAPTPLASLTPATAVLPSPSLQSATAPVALRKRAAEDMSQYADQVSHDRKLVKTDHDELTAFSKAAWVIPKHLHSKINENAAVLMIDASIPAYRDDKGFTAEMKTEKDAVDAVASDISKVLTAKRSIMKGAIISLLGSALTRGRTSWPGALDIVELSHLIVAKLKVWVKVDIHLCGRVAVLCKLISEKNDYKYWGDVDKKLASVRERHPDTKSQSKWIKQHMLDPDLVLYKHVDLKNLEHSSSGATVPVAGPSTLPADEDPSDDGN
ncbi:hypothetical protein C8R45DRAFT_1101969 [Mycena sanguinolenta]|nr:hypothetical protein C8R45DRAFT_1101969 [Mycena sanguinolenta]